MNCCLTNKVVALLLLTLKTVSNALIGVKCALDGFCTVKLQISRSIDEPCLIQQDKWYKSLLIRVMTWFVKKRNAEPINQLKNKFYCLNLIELEN